MPSPEMPASSTPVRGRHPLLTKDFFIKNATLVVSIIIVAIFYSVFVRPEALNIAMENRLRAAQDPEGFVEPRSFVVVIKDFEQQSCITLWLWAIMLMTLKLRRLSVENSMLAGRYLELEPGERILPDDTLGHFKDLNATIESRPGWRERILPNVILAALQRFHATNSIQDAAQSIKERAEVSAEELEADLSLTRYIIWAIPSIGFIGTVRGIGEALAQANKALAGDISGVTSALGLAFNSTLVALLLSLVLMFMLHLLQGRQDNLILEIQNFCHEHIVGQMKIPAQESRSPVYPS